MCAELRIQDFVKDETYQTQNYWCIELLSQERSESLVYVCVGGGGVPRLFSFRDFSTQICILQYSRDYFSNFGHLVEHQNQIKTA